MKRSKSFPVLSVEQAASSLVHEVGVLEKDLRRDELARRLGYATGSGGVAGRKIAALTSYGLLEYGGGKYRLGDLGKRLLDAEPDSLAYRRLIVAACRRPPLFAEVLSVCARDGRLPVDLRSMLQDYGIVAKATAEVEQVVLRSLEYAGLVDEMGRFLGYDVTSRQSPTSVVQPEVEEDLSSGQKGTDSAGGLHQRIGPVTRGDETAQNGRPEMVGTLPSSQSMQVLVRKVSEEMGQYDAVDFEAISVPLKGRRRACVMVVVPDDGEGVSSEDLDKISRVFTANFEFVKDSFEERREKVASLDEARARRKSPK